MSAFDPIKGLFKPAQILRSGEPGVSRRQFLGSAAIGVAATSVGRALAQELEPASAAAPENVDLIAKFVEEQFTKPVEKLGEDTEDKEKQKQKVISILQIGNSAFKQISKSFPKKLEKQIEASIALQESIDMKTLDILDSLEFENFSDVGYFFNSPFTYDLEYGEKNIEALAADIGVKPDEINLFIKCEKIKPVNPKDVPFVVQLLSPLSTDLPEATVLEIDDPAFDKYGVQVDSEIIINKARLGELVKTLDIKPEDVRELVIANEYMHFALKQALDTKTFGETKDEKLIVEGVIPDIDFYLNNQAGELLSDAASLNVQPRDIARILGDGIINKDDSYYSTQQLARKVTKEFCDKHGIAEPNYRKLDGTFQTLKKHFDSELEASSLSGDELLEAYLKYVPQRYREVGEALIETIKANKDKLPDRTEE